MYSMHYLNHVSSDIVIIQISLIVSNGGNRCRCNVCDGGAQTNNSVGAHCRRVTVVELHYDIVISDCRTTFPSHFHSYVAFIIINQIMVILVIFMISHNCLFVTMCFYSVTHVARSPRVMM